MTQDGNHAGHQAPLAPGLVAHAVDLHRKHQLAQALPVYRRARTLMPADPVIMHFQAMAEIHGGDMPHGLALLGRCRSLAPDLRGLEDSIASTLPAAWARTADTLSTPSWDCATIAALMPLGLPGPFLDAVRARVSKRWQAEAFALYRDGRMDEAHALLAPVVGVIGDDTSLLNLHAVIQRRRGYPEDAAAILRRCRHLDPADDTVLFNLAGVLLEIREREAAIQCYQALAGRALDDHNGFRLEKAEAISRKLTQIVPVMSSAWAVLGLTLSRLGRHAEAADALATAIRCASSTHVPPYRFYADALRLGGRMAMAERAYRQAAAMDPLSAEAIGGIGLIHAARGETAQAHRLLERSQRLKSHVSSTSAALTCLRLRRSAPAGTPFPRRGPSGRGVLSVSSLNSYGRLAHNINDYIATRLYAEKYGLDVETPEWAGALLFDLDDPLMDKPRRNILNDHSGFRERFRAGLLGDDAEPFRDVDVFLGWPVMELADIAAHRATVQGWMKPRAMWDPWLRPAVDRLNAAGETIVAVHIRRTDRSAEGGVDFAGYRAWLGEMWDTQHRPVLLVATDDPSVLPEFAPFAPHTLRSLAEPWRGLEHLQDFHLLMNADVVAVSVGGFARLAAALGTRTRLVVEADRNTGGFRPVPLWE